jgi:chromosome segregation ATPase
VSESAEALAVYAQRIMDLEAKEAKAQARIKQLEIGHDEWRTHARRAEAEVERLRDEIAAVKTDNYRINRHRDECEAELERLREAAEYACDEHEKECGTQCSECKGMMELRAALRGEGEK